MKAFTLVTTLVSAAAAEKFVVGPDGWSKVLGLNLTQSEEQPQLIARQAAKGAASGAGKTTLKNRLPNIAGAKSVKIRYGPFTVRGGGPNGGEGMIWNQPTPSITKPCSDCTILGMNAGLEYLDGKDANTDTKMWLHHMVLFNIGTGAWDATCTVFGLPHMIVASSPTSSERIFSSGNERTTVFFNPPWYNNTKSGYGYPVYSADRFGLITDLMNMNPGAKTVYLTMYYDFLDGHPKEWAEIKPVWFDVAQCGTSEVPGGSANTRFDIKASAWTANFEGEILHAGGHLHDGGTAVDLLVDGKLVCKSEATYGSDEEALIRSRAAIEGKVYPLVKGAGAAPPAAEMKDVLQERQEPKGKGGAPAPAAKSGGGGGHSHGGGRHIIAMSICTENRAKVKDMPITTWGIKDLKKGQKWVLRATYDYNKHMGMKQGGTQKMSSVMGIAIMFVKTSTKRKA